MLREMIAEYRDDQARSRFLGATWKRGRAVIVAVAASVIFVTQLVTAYAVLTAGGHP